MKIAVAKGDGIGPEIMDAVLSIFKAHKVPLEYEFVDMGKWVFDKGFSNGMTPECKSYHRRSWAYCLKVLWKHQKERVSKA